MSVIRRAVLVGLLLAVTGCGADQTTASEATPPSDEAAPAASPPSSGTPEPQITAPPTYSTTEPGRPKGTIREAPEPTVPPTLAEPPPSLLLDAAVADLAGMLGIDPAEIGVVALEEVTWRNGSIGCPEPGMEYTEALVNGVRIRLLAGGAVYEYHSRGTADPFYCADSDEPLPPGTGGSGDT